MLMQAIKNIIKIALSSNKSPFARTIAILLVLSLVGTSLYMMYSGKEWKYYEIFATVLSGIISLAF